MKISIIGAGQVGAAATLDILEKHLADELVVTDVIEGMPQGKALDMFESTPVKALDVKVKGTNNLADIAGSQIVVITAGFPRKPGMTRMDLFKMNLDIIKPMTENIVKYAPDSNVLVVTNPLDIMTYAALKLSRFPPHRVFGMAGVLDTSRFRSFVAMELGVSVEDVSTMVLGGHGDAMVPLTRLANVSGIPLTELMTKEQLDRIVKRTREAGTEIVQLLKTGSAYYAPGAAVTQMVEAMVKDRRRVLPACAYLQGQYGYTDVCAGVPVILGKNGVQKILEVRLTEDEKAQFQKSVDELVNTIKEMRANNLL